MRARSLVVLPFALVACADPGSSAGIQSDAVGEVADTVADTASADTTPADTTPVDTTPADTAPDTVVPEDTAPETSPDTFVPADTTPVEDTAPDTFVPEDTTPPEDTSGPACDDCLTTGAGPIGIAINNDSTSTPPVLGGVVGAEAMSGVYELDTVDVYTKGAFDGFLVTSATLDDNGESSGTVLFDGARWIFYLDLDLAFTANTVIGAQSGVSRNQIQGGGCFTIDQNALLGDTSTCASGWPTGTVPPEYAEFEHDSASGVFTLKILLDKGFVLALIPPEYQQIAGGAIKGPITFVATLSAAP